jgi:hypothetical protein
VAYQTDTVVNKVAYVLIGVGFIDFIRRWKQPKFDWNYALISAGSAAILSLSFLIPLLAPAFLADRLYHVSLFFLAPFLVLGGSFVFRLILKLLRTKPRLPNVSVRPVAFVILVILLFKVGFVYEALGDVPYSTSLSFARMQSSHDETVRMRFYEDYVPEQDVASATWLSEVKGNSGTYADHISSAKILRAYGMMVLEWDHQLSNDSKIENASYIYLRYYNVIDRMLVDPDENPLSLTRFSSTLRSSNMIYSNGAGEIFLTFSMGSQTTHGHSTSAALGNVDLLPAAQSSRSNGPQSWSLIKAILDGYEGSYKGTSNTFSSRQIESLHCQVAAASQSSAATTLPYERPCKWDSRPDASSATPALKLKTQWLKKHTRTTFS